MEANLVLTPNEFITTNRFIFKIGDAPEPVIVIDTTGFWYKGELVEDSGEVYRLFKEFIQIANR